MSRWPFGTTEMAGRVREYDWAATPLGPIGAWSPALRIAVNLTLDSPVATNLLWGTAYIQIYNDHWRDLVGAKHPAALGQRTLDCFPEVARTMAPLYAQAWRGEPVILNNALLPVDRHGGVQDAWWDASFLPVRDESGVVGGLLCTVVEATSAVLARREREQAEARRRADEARHTFLLKLSDALRLLGNAVEIQDTAMRLLGEELGVVGAGYAVMDDDQDGFTLGACWQKEPTALPQHMRLSDFGSDVARACRSGRTVAYRDIEADPRLESRRPAYRALSVRAWAATPLVKGERLIAVLGVHCTTPRDWSHGEIQLLEAVAERTWAAVERARAETALRTSEQRHALLLRLSDVLDVVADPRDAQRAAMRLLGDALGVDQAYYFRAERVGEGWAHWVDRDHFSRSGMPPRIGRRLLADFGATLFAPLARDEPVVVDDIDKVEGLTPQNRENFRIAHAKAILVAPVLEHGRYVAGLSVQARSPRRWTASEVLLVRNAAESIWATLERAHAEAALRDSEEQLRLTVELVPALLWQTSPAGKKVSVNYRWKSYTGQSDADVQSLGWLHAIHPDDREAARSAFEAALASGTALEYQQRIHQAGNGWRWHLVRQYPARDDKGAITRWFGAAIDIHDLHELQQRQQVLVAELQHRTRNLMGVVQAMAERTIEVSASLADFRDRFSHRLAALARVQGLLSRLGEADRVEFDRLLETELAAMDGAPHKVSLDGPRGIRLRSGTVQVLALALHELMTNSLKYGALGQPGQAHLEIRWSLEPRDERGRPWLRIDWRESGVDMASSELHARGSGEGRELIEKALPYQLGARTRYTIGATGVHCTISVPVSASNAAPQTDDH